MLKPKTQQQEQGFSLVEVLVAILIATIFVTVAMQMLAIAAIFKVRAQEYAEATTWIQEDLEQVKYYAANYQYSALKAAASSTDTVIQVASVDNFQVGDSLVIGSDTNNTIQSINSTTTPPTITLTSALGTNWLIDTVVVATTKCNAVSADAGFADALRDLVNDPSNLTLNRTSVSSVKKNSLTKKEFTFKRTTNIPSNAIDAPYKVLQITYDVTPTSGGSSIAQFYTEVIPNAALQCP